MILGLGKGRTPEMYLNVIIIGAILLGKKDREDLYRGGWSRGFQFICALEPFGFSSEACGPLFRIMALQT